MVAGLNKEDRGVKRYAVLVFILGLILTVFITHIVYRGQQQLAESNFEFLTDNQAENIKELVMLDISFIGAGASFYHATQHRHGITLLVSPHHWSMVRKA